MFKGSWQRFMFLLLRLVASAQGVLTNFISFIHSFYRDIMRRPHFLTQNVTIVGPGDPNFDVAISALGCVAQFFSQSFSQGSF